MSITNLFGMRLALSSYFNKPDNKPNEPNDNANSISKRLQKPAVDNSTKAITEKEEPAQTGSNSRFPGLGSKWMPSFLSPHDTVTNQAVLYQFGPHLMDKFNETAPKESICFRKMMNKKYDDSWFVHEMARSNVIC